MLQRRCQGIRLLPGAPIFLEQTPPTASRCGTADDALANCHMRSSGPGRKSPNCGALARTNKLREGIEGGPKTLTGRVGPDVNVFRRAHRFSRDLLSPMRAGG